MDPDNLPNCPDCGDVIMYCKCIEKLNDENFKMYMNGEKCPQCSKKDYIVPIAYGYPSPELLNEAGEGKVSLFQQSEKSIEEVVKKLYIYKNSL